MTELCDLPGHELARRYRAGEATPTEAFESCLRRIEAVDDRLHSFLLVTEGAARMLARQLENRTQPSTGMAQFASKTYTSHDDIFPILPTS